MTRKAAITVLGPPEEIRGRWRDADHPASVFDGATVSFRDRKSVV